MIPKRRIEFLTAIAGSNATDAAIADDDANASTTDVDDADAARYDEHDVTRYGSCTNWPNDATCLDSSLANDYG